MTKLEIRKKTCCWWKSLFLYYILEKSSEIIFIAVFFKHSFSLQNNTVAIKKDLLKWQLNMEFIWDGIYFQWNIFSKNFWNTSRKIPNIFYDLSKRKTFFFLVCYVIVYKTCLNKIFNAILIRYLLKIITLNMILNRLSPNTINKFGGKIEKIVKNHKNIGNNW